MGELKLVITHYKILDTVYELNKEGYYPLVEGVYKIVAGVDDEEMKDFSHLKTYSTLISYGSKKVARYVLMLQRRGYLEKVFHRDTNNLYLSITEKGISALNTYHKKHKTPYIKKAIQLEKTIVKIK